MSADSLNRGGRCIATPDADFILANSLFFAEKRGFEKSWTVPRTKKLRVPYGVLASP